MSSFLGCKGKIRQRQNSALLGTVLRARITWVATNRYDLTAEDVAQVYKLRWSIESFFGWWKRHMKVYHLIARSQYVLMVQLLAGLNTLPLLLTGKEKK